MNGFTVTFDQFKNTNFLKKNFHQYLAANVQTNPSNDLTSCVRADSSVESLIRK